MIFTDLYIPVKGPEELFGELFIAVQMGKIFSDYKTFPDCTPLIPVSEIMSAYHAQKNLPEFNLQNFVEYHFQLPDSAYLEYQADTNVTAPEHIGHLWDVLTREAKKPLKNSSLISLPYPYVVPGGRFREVFYWDSYFIMLGLKVSGRKELLQNMLHNFTFLIDSLGYIPNGNRTYFLSRSQPPFYAMMVTLLTGNNDKLLIEYLPRLEREYRFWMDGADKLSKKNTGCKRVVRLEDGDLLNRYWDDKNTPRAEAFGKEIELSAIMSKEEAGLLYTNVRAACESGWDFSTRWFKEGKTMKTIHTIDLIPVDLNCLMYFLEQTIGKAYQAKRDMEKAERYKRLALKRKQAIHRYCWSEEEGFFMDYDFTLQHCSPCYSLAGVFPLFFTLATEDQAGKVAEKLEASFLKEGGFVTTLHSSNYQWDSPNGWAPLQWITVKGLFNYYYHDLATEGAERWLKLNDRIYKNTGKFTEKYNVVEMNLHTGGGEYPLQDGFGWTNGVYLQLKALLKKE